jgi:hypothetical protein
VTDKSIAKNNSTIELSLSKLFINDQSIMKDLIINKSTEHTNDYRNTSFSERLSNKDNQKNPNYVDTADHHYVSQQRKNNIEVIKNSTCGAIN